MGKTFVQLFFSKSEPFSFEFLCYHGRVENIDNKTYNNGGKNLKSARLNSSLFSLNQYEDALVSPDSFRFQKFQKLKVKVKSEHHVSNFDKQTYFLSLNSSHVDSTTHNFNFSFHVSSLSYGYHCFKVQHSSKGKPYQE